MKKATIFSVLLATVLLSACSKTQNSQPTPTPVATPTPVISNDPEPTPIVETDVVLEIPDVTEAVSSPLNIEGLAPGTWFFEANLRGEIVSEDGTSLATFPLTAIGEWMTEEHVRFEGKAEFEAPEGDQTVELIIKNDNPSGLPENEKSQSFTLLLEK